MTRTAFLRRMLERYGSETMVTVPGESPVTVRAMIRAINYKNKVYLGDAQTPEGYFDNSHLFYVGPPDYRLDQMNGATLRYAEKEYKVIRTQSFLAGNRISYVWAILWELPREKTDDGI